MDTSIAVATVETKSSEIPLDIVHDILLRLPIKCLLRFKTVCKSWRSLISDPKFRKSHVMMNTKQHHNVSYIHLSNDKNNNRRPLFYIDQSSWTTTVTSIEEASSEIKNVDIDFPFEYSNRINCNVVLGSCNGLLLISSSSSNNQTFLWNPTTREHAKILPRKEIWAEYWYANYVSGLGYDSSNDEYKAVISFLHRGRAHVFIFRSRSSDKYWKEVDEEDNDHDLPWSINKFVWFSLGLTVNGAPHWVVTDRSNGDDVNRNRTIVYFDMVDEKFKKLPATPTMSWWNDGSLHYNMAVLEGCLCIVHKIIGDDLFNFWVLKEYGGVRESWTKLFVIRHGAWNLIPLGLVNNGDEVVLHTSSDSLVTYNLKTREEKLLVSTTRNFGIHVGASYVESLVLPARAIGKKDAK